jgi:hypothetical protein
MGFSAEVSISMADGTTKTINNVRVGDYIQNKHGKPVRVNANYKQVGEDCVSFEVDGDATTLYCTPDQKFLAYCTHTGGNMMCDYLTLADMDECGAVFKNSKIIFSTTNNVAVNNYNASTTSKDVWSIDISGRTKSFVVNTVIAVEDERI